MVSFKSESVKQRIEKRRKAQSFSFGMIIVLLVLTVVIGIFGVMKYWQLDLERQIKEYDEEINGVENTKNIGLKGEMRAIMNSEEGDFYKRMDLMKRELYRKHSSVAILNEIENVVIPDVVLLSFSHTVESSGAEKVVITADANTIELMAQQVEQFKNSAFFSNVRVGDTSRDSAGRFVFKITADVADTKYVLYSENEVEAQRTVREAANGVGAVQQPIEEVQEVEAGAEAEVTAEEVQE